MSNESQITARSPSKKLIIGDFAFKNRLQMSATIITTEDLREFKMELLDDIKELLKSQSGQVTKKWLKSPEVRELLSVSP